MFVYCILHLKEDDEKHLRINNVVRRPGAHPLRPLSRRRLDPIKLAYKSQKGPLLHRTRRFFLNGGRCHQQY